MNQNDNSWVVGTILKCIFIPLGLALFIFLFVTFGVLFINIVNASNGGVNALPVIISRGVIPILQLGIPVLIVLFGWLIILLIDLEKHKK